MISVIIPVYNGEKYINTIYSCLKEQTYRDLEIIFINDGSTDKSGEICDKIASEDSRVIVIHQENAGVSAARNAALDIVKGEYTAFIDVDDRIKPDYFDVLLSEAEKTCADIVCCGREDLIPLPDNNFAFENSKRYTHIPGFYQTKSQYSTAYLDKNFWLCVVWAKLFKTEIARSVRFRPIRYAEDTLYIHDVLKECTPKIYVVEYVGYSYILWETSAIRNPKIQGRDLERARASAQLMHLYTHLDDTHKDEELRIKEYFGYFTGYLYATVWSGAKELYYSEEFEKQVYFDEYRKYLKTDRYLPSFKSKILFKTYLLSKRLCWFVVKMYRRSRPN